MTDAVEPPYPALTAENAFFWLSGEDGTLRFKRCGGCGTWLHPPSPVCPTCLSDDIRIEPVSGRATVAAYSINHHQWHPAFPPPYVIAIVEIEEAAYVRLTTRIVNCDPAKIDVGTPVQVVFEKTGPAWLPLFEPRTA